MQSTQQLIISVQNAAPARCWNPGHYVTVGRTHGRRTSYHQDSRAWETSGKGLLGFPGVRGIQLRYQWKTLETALNSYTIAPILADITRVRSVGSRLIIMIEDRAFDGSNPCPGYLTTSPKLPPPDNYGDYEVMWVATLGGYMATRWNPHVQQRWQKLIAWLGSQLNGTDVLEAIAFQETASTSDAGQRAAALYTDLKYQQAYIGGQVYGGQTLQGMLKVASDSFSAHRVFWYQNFFPNPSTEQTYLQGIADTMRDYNGGNSGVVLGGPDILPDSNGLESRVYPRYREPPVGSWGELPLFCSNQFDSYEALHDTSTPDARLPSDTWSAGDYWTMDQLFRWARDSLHINYCMWEAEPRQNFQTIANVTKANPAVVTCAGHGFANGRKVWIRGASGMTQLNQRVFQVANATTNTFELLGVNSTSYGTYVADSGTVQPAGPWALYPNGYDVMAQYPSWDPGVP